VPPVKRKINRDAIGGRKVRSFKHSQQLQAGR